MGEDVVLLDEESKPGVKLDFKLAVLWQVVAVNRLFNTGDPQVSTAIDALEASLIGYVDKSNYAESIKQARSAFDEAKTNALELDKIARDKRVAQASFEFALAKYRELMRIVYARILGTEEVIEA